MTQQLDPKQVRGLKEELDTLDSMAKIKTIGANLSLSDEGELSATGGGGGGGGTLYSTLGQNTDGALTQKASTDLLVHAKPDGANDLISNNKITMSYLPDSILGQVVYGGGFIPGLAIATLTTNAQEKLGTTSATITLTNDTTAITGYKANEGIYYIATGGGTFASISFVTGDWLISTGNAWSKVDNTDAVTGVKGDAQSVYYTGNVNLTSANIGAIANTTGSVATSNIADDAVTTAKILDSNVTTAKILDSNVTTAKIADGNVTTAKIADSNVTTAKIADSNVTTDKINDSAVTTAKINDGAVTTAKINDGAVTNAKIGSAAVKASNIDFTTLNFGNYSETEQDTGFTWVNGHSIYKKTVHFGSLPNGGSRSVNHNISNMDQLIEISGIASGSNGDRYPIPKYMLNTNYGTQIKITSTAIQMDTNSGVDMSSFDAWITLLYTKTS